MEMYISHICCKVFKIVMYFYKKQAESYLGILHLLSSFKNSDKTFTMNIHIYNIQTTNLHKTETMLRKKNEKAVSSSLHWILVYWGKLYVRKRLYVIGGILVDSIPLMTYNFFCNSSCEGMAEELGGIQNISSILGCRPAPCTIMEGWPIPSHRW